MPAATLTSGLLSRSDRHRHLDSRAVVGDASTGDLWLENNAGVVMHLKAKREGLMLSLGADVVDVRMDE